MKLSDLVDELVEIQNNREDNPNVKFDYGGTLRYISEIKNNEGGVIIW